MTTYFVLLLQEVVGLILYRLTHSGLQQQICLLKLKCWGWLYGDRHTGRRSCQHPTSYSLQSSYLSGPSPLWDSAASLKSHIERRPNKQQLIWYLWDLSRQSYYELILSFHWPNWACCQPRAEHNKAKLFPLPVGLSNKQCCPVFSPRMICRNVRCLL